MMCQKASNLPTTKISQHKFRISTERGLGIPYSLTVRLTLDVNVRSLLKCRMSSRKTSPPNVYEDRSIRNRAITRSVRFAKAQSLFGATGNKMLISDPISCRTISAVNKYYAGKPGTCA